MSVGFVWGFGWNMVLGLFGSVYERFLEAMVEGGVRADESGTWSWEFEDWHFWVFWVWDEAWVWRKALS